MIRKNLNSLLFLASLLLLVSCDFNKVYDEYTAINSNGWSVTDTVSFEVEMSSTEGELYDCLLGLRNNNDYLFSNVFLFVEVENPKGETRVDTLQYLLAESNGTWLGTGVGEIKHMLLTYKEAQAFEEGVYTYKIVHGMRDEVLYGLEDIGLRIESVK